MSFIKLLLGLPLLFVLLIFAFVNNDMATFSLWPLGIEITVSLSVAIVFLVLVGYVFGRIFAWLSYSPVRSALRTHKKENKKLSKEQEKLSKEVVGLQSNIESLKNVSTEAPVLTWKDKFRKAFGLKKANI